MLELVFSKIKLLYTSSFICKTCTKLCICLFFQDVLEAQCGIVQHNENLLWNSFLMLFNSLNEQPKVSSIGFTTQHYMLCQCLFIGKTSVFSFGHTKSSFDQTFVFNQFSLEYLKRSTNWAHCHLQLKGCVE